MDLRNSKNEIFNAAWVISGLRLPYDLSSLNLYTLELLLAKMQFFIKKQIPEHSIFLYTSLLYNKEETTVVFINPGYRIKEVRYMNLNPEKLLSI